MKVLTNSRRKQHFVQTKNNSINTYMTVPFAGVHRAAKLTIKSGDTRLDLNGRQIRALRSVIDKSLELMSKKNSR